MKKRPLTAKRPGVIDCHTFEQVVFSPILHFWLHCAFHISIVLYCFTFYAAVPSVISKADQDQRIENRWMDENIIYYTLKVITLFDQQFHKTSDYILSV